MVVCSFCNLLYIASYLIPVACEKSSEGLCNKIFSGILIVITGTIGGFIQSVSWAAKRDYIRRHEGSEDEYRMPFMVIIGLSSIAGAVIAIILMESTTIRAGLYVIFTLLSATSFLIQMCNSLMLILSYSRLSTSQKAKYSWCKRQIIRCFKECSKQRSSS